MVSKREMQEEARREYDESPERQQIFEELRKKNTQIMNITEKDNRTEELTESQKKQIAFGRKLMASKHATLEESRRDYEDPKIRAILEELYKKAKNAAE